MKTRFVVLGVAVMAAVLVRPLGAASSVGTVSATVTVSATAKLALSASTITFVNADPDTIPSIPASEGVITITAKAKTATGAAVTLTVLTANDLMSGSDTIVISNVTWTASGAGFIAGTMNKTVAQPVATFTGSGNRSGTQTYVLANSWTYPTGNFSTTATYTLTAP